MSVRTIPDDFAAGTVAEIDRRLDAACREHEVAIPLAVESGSRAWGFPSPDSDYDCRFLFVRPAEHLLSPWPRRDVIETPLVGDLDVNGWELGKALRLMLNGNAVIIEWLTSPIVYRGEAWLRDGLLELARRHADRDAIARHYLHLGENQRKAHLADPANVPLKKLFYALRPAAALRWLRRHPLEAVAPMHLPTLIAACDPPVEVAEITAQLIARKAVTLELGSEPLPAPIGRFVDAELAAARAAFPRRGERLSLDARREAEELFRAVTARLHGPR